MRPASDEVCSQIRKLKSRPSGAGTAARQLRYTLRARPHASHTSPEHALPSFVGSVATCHSAPPLLDQNALTRQFVGSRSLTSMLATTSSLGSFGFPAMCGSTW